MKKAIFAVFVVFSLSFCCRVVCGQGEAGSAGAKGAGASTFEEKKAGTQSDSNQSGRLSPQLRRRRQEQMRRKARRRMIEARRKGAGKYKGDEVGGEGGKGLDRKQQVKMIETQMAKQEAKHWRRLARLKRIEELAVEENSTKVILRVRRLIRKEQQRFRDKQRHLHRRMRRLVGGEGPGRVPRYDERFRGRIPRPIEKGDWAPRGRGRGDANEPARGKKVKE